MSIIKETELIIVDSRNRERFDQVVYGNLRSLTPFPLIFHHNSNQIDILTEGLEKIFTNQIVLKNISSKSVLLRNPLSVKKNSQYVRVQHSKHGLSLYDTYDSTKSEYFQSVFGIENISRNYSEEQIIKDSQNYYVLRNQRELKIKISNVVTDNPNFPSNYINGIHQIYLIFTQKGSQFYPDPDSYLIKLKNSSKINYSMNFVSSINNVLISFLNLYGIPLNSISDRPLNIINQTSNKLTVEIDSSAIVDPRVDFYDQSDLYDFSSIEINENNRGGGGQVYLQEVVQIKNGYPNPNNYVYQLNQEYNNVTNIRVTSTNFKNTIPNVKSDNNKLYWKILSDGNTVYQLQISPGYYTIERLASEIQSMINQTPRLIDRKLISTFKTDYDINGRYLYNLSNVQIDLNRNFSISFKNRRLLFDTIDNPIIRIIDEEIVLLKSSIDLNSDYILKNGFVYEKISPYSYNLNTGMRIHIYLTEANFNYAFLGYEMRVVHSDSLTKTVYFNDTSLLRIGDYYVTDIFSDIDSNLVYQIEKINGDSVGLKELNINQTILVNEFLINQNSYQKIDTLSEVNYEASRKINRKILINHTDHNLDNGMIITISNSRNLKYVPANIVNNNHQIQILTNDYYVIQLPIYQPVENYNNDLNYNEIIIDYPEYGQLLFDRNDTLGNLLRFPNVGDLNAITLFNHVLRNTDSYQISIPRVFSPIYDYFYICIADLPSVVRNAPVSNAIAVVRIVGPYGTPMIDTFIRNNFDSNWNKLIKISQLEIQILYPDGSRVDFDDSEHFFTLEIEKLYRRPTNQLE